MRISVRLPFGRVRGLNVSFIDFPRIPIRNRVRTRPKNPFENHSAKRLPIFVPYHIYDERRWRGRLYEAGNSVGCVRIKSIVIRIGMTRHSDNKWKRRSHFKSGARPRRGSAVEKRQRDAVLLSFTIVLCSSSTICFFFRFHPLMYFSLSLRHFDFFFLLQIFLPSCAAHYYRTPVRAYYIMTRVSLLAVCVLLSLLSHTCNEMLYV